MQFSHAMATRADVDIVSSSSSSSSSVQIQVRPALYQNRRTSSFTLTTLTSTNTAATLSLAPLYLTTCSFLYYFWSLPDLICAAHTLSYFFVKLLVVPCSLVLGYRSVVALEGLRFLLTRA